ncbi:MAG TPA: fused MFS/spermidine synthase [Polyangia bacterium]|nr:fused MFS/spermidine synthase [Polyangia bacterium]
MLAETAWVPLVASVVGSDGGAVLAVLSAFFLGSALGARTLGRRCERRVEAGGSPRRELAKLCAAGCLGVLASLLTVPIGRRVIPFLALDAGALHTGVALTFAALAFLPATMSLGGSFAVLGRGLLPPRGDSSRPSTGSILGSLQAWSTAGAIAGALFATFCALPRWGLSLTIVSAAGMLALTTAVALTLDARRRAGPAEPSAGRPSSSASSPGAAILIAAGATGAAGLFFEVAAIRVLTGAFDGTASAFGTIVAAQLLGGALGAGLARALKPGSVSLPTSFAIGALGVALAALLLAETGTFLRWFAVTGVIGTETLTACCLVAPSAALTSFLFVRVIVLAADNPEGLASLTAASAAGAAAAPLLGGVALLPLWGTPSLLVAAVTSLAVGGASAARARGAGPLGSAKRTGLAIALSAAAIILVAGGARSSRLFAWPLSQGERSVFLSDSADGVVRVEESATGSMRLRTGSRFLDGGEESRFGERRQGYLPLLLHPAPRDVLVLGVGTAATLSAVAQDHEVAHIDAVELSSEVLSSLNLFSWTDGGALTQPRVRLRHADARAFVSAAAASGIRYDVVIADLFHPQRAGAGTLYTREHFTNIRRALAPRGCFVQWLPLHELSPEALAAVVATFLDVFPHAEAFLAYFNARIPALGLVGAARADATTDAPLVIDLEAFARRLASTPPRTSLADTLLDWPEELFGGFAADRAALVRLAAGGAVATDDHPLVERLAALGTGPPFASLERVLNEGEPAALPVRMRGADGTTRIAALGRYRAAVFANLRGQITQLRGDLARARQYYEAGLADDERLSLNRFLLDRLPPIGATP